MELYQGRLKTTGHVVVTKKIRWENKEGMFPSIVTLEISLLEELCHSDTVSLQDALMSILGYISSVNTWDLKKHSDAIPSGQFTGPSLVICTKSCKGLSSVTLEDTLQRLETSNPTDNEGTTKLAGFGLARAFGIPIRGHTHEV